MKEVKEGLLKQNTLPQTIPWLPASLKSLHRGHTHSLVTYHLQKCLLAQNHKSSTSTCPLLTQGDMKALGAGL